MVQPVPFQRSARVLCPLPARDPPTAMQVSADVHDTPSSTAPVDRATCGVGLMRQRVPFHSIASAEPPLPMLPTAMQKRADAQDTAMRTASEVPDPPMRGVG